MATNLRLVCDPTETIVEWVVEWKKGNQDAFTYAHTINLKGLNKNFAWHTDMRHGFPVLPPSCLCASSVHQKKLASSFLSACIEILSPPPECSWWL
ncbi:hypothetical protein Q4E93_24845 [Flavitalea sp. BT771]|uniref:hypothetical protein n=1 Tax=Flavitalea sp. BT771 TaxID=3063329 RepID=UPI0026E39E71|nr:hypothetical protein [Flavitalea sp. BT771]MDO6433858.1 hypothetical protein [Flavitalea sp. BT771]MDV6222237.1 hypothetical protein [Flavitalea sp. BT771]